MARRKKTGPGAVYTRLAQISREELSRRRVARYAMMGDALAGAGIVGWGTDDRLRGTDPDEPGSGPTHRAAYQAARMSLEAWSKVVGKGTESQRFTAHKGKPYRIITRKRDGKGVRGRKIVSEATMKRSAAAVAYQSRIRVIRDTLGGTHAQARASYAREWESWDKRMWGGEKAEAVEAVKGPGVTFVDPTGMGPQTVPDRVVFPEREITPLEEKEAALALSETRALRRERAAAEAKFKRVGEKARERQAKRRADYERRK